MKVTMVHSTAAQTPLHDDTGSNMARLSATQRIRRPTQARKAYTYGRMFPTPASFAALPLQKELAGRFIFWKD
jgi:hypothetical protein